MRPIAFGVSAAALITMVSGCVPSDVQDPYQRAVVGAALGAGLGAGLGATFAINPGIGSIVESARRYPAGQLAASVIGDVGTDAQGLDGLEYLYDKTLAGKPGELVVEQDQQGHDIPNTQRSRVEARRGTDVVLTLDRDLQFEVESSLLDQVTATRAKGGMAAVIDVQDGDVLAMGTVEGATPNRTGLGPDQN